MIRNIVKPVVFVALIGFVCGDAMAQRSPRRPRPNSGNQPTTQPGTEQPRVGNQPPVVPSGINLPVIYDTASLGEGFGGPSLRNDNAFDKSNITERTPLPYDHIRWDDALYAEKVWRELDFREKLNKVFQYEAVEDNGSQLFINILLDAVNKGEVAAFMDDSFRTPLDSAALALQTAGGFDTSYRYNIDDPTLLEAMVVSKKTFDTKGVNKLRVKEEWVFDRESSKMVCRILGISPLLTQFQPNGDERGSSPMFWVYYPDLRPILAKYEVYNGRNMGASRMTWEELFESRMFSSYITKSTISNPGNKTIRQVIKDPILALLEGDNIKNKIFDFEQDLWEY